MMARKIVRDAGGKDGKVVQSIRLDFARWLMLAIPWFLVVMMMVWQALTYCRALSERLDGVAAVLTVTANQRELFDRRQAMKWLSVFQNDADIDVALLVLADRRVTAVFRRGADAEYFDSAPYLAAYKRLQEENPIDRPAYRLGWQGLDLVAPLIQENRLLGYLYAHAPLGTLSEQLLINLLLLASIVLLACGAGARLEEWRSGHMFAPLQQLAEAMRQAGNKCDFGVRSGPFVQPAIGEVAGLACAFDDMMKKLAEYESRRAERASELLESNRELSVAVRRASEAQNAAEHTSRAMSSLLSTISHDIRTPMTGILGMTELLLKSRLGDEQRAHADTVMNSARTLLTVFDDLADLSNLEAGVLALDANEFNLRELVEESVDLFAERAQGKGLHIGCLLAPDTPSWVYGDAQRLRQILSNLLSNATKFTVHGEVRVDVGVESRTGSAAVLSIKVSDTGIGIDASRQKALFDASGFDVSSVPDNRSPERRSTARLGLALVKQLLTLMGGEVGVSSVAGQGSTFWLKIPVAVRGRQSEKELSANGLCASRLLIVNDNVLNRALLAQHLRNWGMRSRIAVNGRVALEALRQAAAIGSPFAVVVLDMLMADLDCLVLIRSIRSDPRFDGLRIVVLTAFNRPAQVVAALAAGADGCLPQPIRQKQLFQTLHRVLGRTLVEENDQENPTSGALRGLRLHVLLVEDDVVSREVALTTLKWLGCRIHAVANGQEALQAYAQESFHLVLMDCQLPDIDGREVTRRIRSLENDAARRDVESRRLPIIAVTANVLVGHRESCLQAGMDDYLTKPYDREGLLTVLRRWAPPETAIPTMLPPAANERRLIDRKVLRTLGEVGNAAFVARVISLFIETMPEKLAILEQAVTEGDGGTMARIARQIKSSGAALGLLGVVKAAAELESNARIINGSNLVGIMASLRTAYNDVLPTLNRLVANSEKSTGDGSDAAMTAA